MPKSTATLAKTLTIDGMSHEGRGIARENGKTLFVLGALPQETVDVRYLHQHRRYSEAIATEIIRASEDRVAPRCPHFLNCGGCSLQHLNSTAQITFKQKVLLEQLQHIGNVKPETILSPLQGDIWGYRRKARLGVRFVNKKNKLLVGFREIDGRYLADIDSCAVLDPRVGEKITLITAALMQLSGHRDIAQIEVACGDKEVALILRHLKPLSPEDLIQLQQFAKQEDFHLYLQPGGPETVKLFWPETQSAYLQYQLPAYDLTLDFAPNDFTQVNASINQKMIARALELLQPAAHEKILDLFCGLGNFSLPLAKNGANVVGIEGDARMVQQAQLNAANNHINNANFYTADLTQDCSHAIWAQDNFDKILLDPPRSGALEVMHYIVKFKAKTILYISCNPATLARDSAELIKQGYRMTHAGVLDMFPHTSHVEAMALFTLL